MTAAHALEKVGDKVYSLVRTALLLQAGEVAGLQVGKPQRGCWRFQAGRDRFDLVAAPGSAGPEDGPEFALRRHAVPSAGLSASLQRAMGDAPAPLTDVEVAFTGAPAEVIALTIVALFQAIRDGNLPPA